MKKDTDINAVVESFGAHSIVVTGMLIETVNAFIMICSLNVL